MTGVWQPIETAPRDGTWVLLCGGKCDDYQWYSGEDAPQVVAFWNKDEWAFANWDGDWRTLYLEPTHWMPLPPPPTPS